MPSFALGKESSSLLSFHEGPTSAAAAGPQAFNVDLRKAGPAQTFHFKRSARRSVLLGLGIAPRTRTMSIANGENMVDLVDPYSKVSTKDSKLIYIALVLGTGIFSLSSAVAKCGFIPGVIVMLTFSCIHKFLCHCIVQMPQLVEKNLETYSDMAAACLMQPCYSYVNLFCMISWCGACTVVLLESWNNFFPLLYALRLHEGSFLGVTFTMYFKAAAVSLTFLLSTRTSNADMRRASKTALASLSLACLIELTAAISYRYSKGMSGPNDCAAANLDATCKEIQPYTWWNTEINDLLDGGSDMVLAYAGVASLPYIVASMVSPEEATKMTADASTVVGTVSMVMGTVCYLGWGNEVVVHCGIRVVEGVGYHKMYACIVLLQGIRAFSAYILLLHPFLREVGQLLHIEEAPAVLLGLPWALRQAKQQKLLVRFLLVVATLLPLTWKAKGEAQNYLKKIYCNLFINAIHFFLPGVLSVASIIVHFTLCQARARDSDGPSQERPFRGDSISEGTEGAVSVASTAPEYEDDDWMGERTEAPLANTKVVYIGKKLMLHLMLSIVVMVILAGFSIYLFGKMLYVDECEKNEGPSNEMIA